MQKATKKNVERANAWIEGLELKLATNTYDALEFAFNTAGRGSYDRYYPLLADTLFLLSDGAPTRSGKPGRRGLGPDDADYILDAVHRWNPFRRIVIHTIGLGIRGKRATFMQRLAEQNGGRCVTPH